MSAPAIRLYADSSHEIRSKKSGQFDASLLSGLNRLRLLSLRCRAARRIDVFSACALLSLDRSEVAHAFADAFLRALPQAIGKYPVFHVPGAVEMSFDEAWILRLLQAISAGQGDSIAFLIASRVRPAYRRQIGYLAKGLSEGLDTI